MDTEYVSYFLHSGNQNVWHKRPIPETLVSAWGFRGCSPSWQGRHWGGVTSHCSGSMRWRLVHTMGDREQGKWAGNGGTCSLQSLPPPWPTYASQAPPPNGSTAFKIAPQAGGWGPAGDILDLNNNTEFWYVCLHKQLFKFIITYVKHSLAVPEIHLSREHGVALPIWHPQQHQK